MIDIKDMKQDSQQGKVEVVEAEKPRSKYATKIPVSKEVLKKRLDKARQVKAAKKQLTYKQAKFVKAYIANNGNGTKAAQESYNLKNYNTAHAVSAENLRKPSIKEAILQASERKGLTIDRVIGRMNVILDKDEYVIPTANLWTKLTGYQDIESNKTNILVLGKQESDAIYGEVMKQYQAIANSNPPSQA